VPGPLASIALPTVHSGGGAAHVQRALSKGAAAYRPVKAGGSLPSLNLAALEAAGDADVKPEQCAAVLATAYVCVLVWAVCRSTPPPPYPPTRPSTWVLAVACICDVMCDVLLLPASTPLIIQSPPFSLYCPPCDRYKTLTNYVALLTFCDGLPELLEPLGATLKRNTAVATGATSKASVAGKASAAGKGKGGAGAGAGAVASAWAPALQVACMECRVAVQKACKLVLQRRMPLQVGPSTALCMGFALRRHAQCVRFFQTSCSRTLPLLSICPPSSSPPPPPPPLSHLAAARRGAKV
jgi:hypothetical protein